MAVLITGEERKAAASARELDLKGEGFHMRQAGQVKVGANAMVVMVQQQQPAGWSQKKMKLF